MINIFKFSPFVLSKVEGLLRAFSAALPESISINYDPTPKGNISKHLRAQRLRSDGASARGSAPTTFAISAVVVKWPITPTKSARRL